MILYCIILYTTVFDVTKFLLFLNISRKDVYNIFQFPVSDAVAPGYSKVIKQPMDFMTMSQKIESNEYSNIDEMKVYLCI